VSGLEYSEAIAKDKQMDTHNHMNKIDWLSLDARLLQLLVTCRRRQ
jgi:hypothetical protein